MCYHYSECRGGGIGRRTGLKILGPAKGVRVRLPPPAPVYWVRPSAQAYIPELTVTVDSSAPGSHVKSTRVLPAHTGWPWQGVSGLQWWSEARLGALLTILGAATVLIAARLLTPDPTGYGTHEHMFLLPCVFHWVTGLPCPFCGMTTACALMARGEIAAAFGAHILGPPGYLAIWGMLLAGGVGLVRNRPVLPRWLRGQRAGRVILLIILLGWVVNLTRVLLQA